MKSVIDNGAVLVGAPAFRDLVVEHDPAKHQLAIAKQNVESC